MPNIRFTIELDSVIPDGDAEELSSDQVDAFDKLLADMEELAVKQGFEIYNTEWEVD